MKTASTCVYVIQAIKELSVKVRHWLLITNAQQCVVSGYEYQTFVTQVRILIAQTICVRMEDHVWRTLPGLKFISAGVEKDGLDRSVMVLYTTNDQNK